LFLNIYKNSIQNRILYVIFSRRFLDCSQNKIVYNFLITSPNRINQGFKHSQIKWIKASSLDKNIIFDKKLKIKSLKFFNFFVIFLDCPSSYLWNLGWHKFCSQALIEKNPSKKLIWFPIIQKKFQKILSKLNSHKPTPNPKSLPQGLCDFRA